MQHDLGDPRRRIKSIDAYRGIIMTALLFNGFGLAETASKHLHTSPSSSFWQVVHAAFGHMEWTGSSPWDLIEPSFFFLIGVSMAYSYAKRARLGQTDRELLTHAVRRSCILILLGVLISLLRSGPGQWSLTNVLTQIGLGYVFVFLLWNRSLRIQAGTVVMILLVSWIAYALFPRAGIDLSTGDNAVGVSKQWAQTHLYDVPDMWHKNANLGHWIDTRLLNALPRSERFVYDEDGYQTLIFLPSMAIMIVGLMTGTLLRAEGSSGRMIVVLATVGLVSIFLAVTFHLAGLCPLIKKVYTTSFVLFSCGCCMLILAGLMLLVDRRGIDRWTFPFRIVGMNSIVAYCLAMLAAPALSWGTKRIFGPDIFQLKTRWGDHVFQLAHGEYRTTLTLYEPTLKAFVLGTALWLLLYVLYRRAIFVRI